MTNALTTNASLFRECFVIFRRPFACAMHASSSVTPLTPYSYKVEMPSDFPEYSIRHIVVAGILLPKDHRVKRNFAGIELAMKLTILTEWSAALDVMMTNNQIDVQIKGKRRPILHGPCGGERMQLLTQVSRMNFTMYPPSSLPASLANAMLSTSQPNFIRRVAMTTNERKQSGVNTDSAMESKRKRENYYEEFMTTPGIEARMTTSEVDRHRKVRFVKRIALAIDTKGSTMQPGYGSASGSGSGSGSVSVSSEGSGRNKDDMSEAEIDKLLGGVMVKYVESCIERCTTREELLSEINWRGYAGKFILLDKKIDYSSSTNLICSIFLPRLESTASRLLFQCHGVDYFAVE